MRGVSECVRTYASDAGARNYGWLAHIQLAPWPQDNKQHPLRAPVVVRRRPARVRLGIPRRHALPQVAERRRHVLVHGHGRVLWTAELGQGRDDSVGRGGVEPEV